MYVVYSICLYFLSIFLFTYNKNHLSKKKIGSFFRKKEKILKMHFVGDVQRLIFKTVSLCIFVQFLSI